MASSTLGPPVTDEKIATLVAATGWPPLRARLELALDAERRARNNRDTTKTVEAVDAVKDAIAAIFAGPELAESATPAPAPVVCPATGEPCASGCVPGYRPFPWSACDDAQRATPPREPDEAGAARTLPDSVAIPLVHLVQLFTDDEREGSEAEGEAAMTALCNAICEAIADARATQAVPEVVRQEIAEAARHRRELSQDSWVLPEDAKKYAALADALDAYLATAPDAAGEGHRG